MNDEELNREYEELFELFKRDKMLDAEELERAKAFSPKVYEIAKMINAIHVENELALAKLGLNRENAISAMKLYDEAEELKANLKIEYAEPLEKVREYKRKLYQIVKNFESEVEKLEKV